MPYELFDAALRSAGVSARRRDRFTDRGDGSLPHAGGTDRQFRVRVVMHTGNVHDDNNRYFSEALDAAFRSRPSCSA